MVRFFLVLSALALSACTSVPEQIQVNEGVELVPFKLLAANPQGDAAIGQPARWGGRIVSVQNKEKVSEIEVVAFPTSSNGKPLTGQESHGRFKAVVEGFVDPLVFEKNRLITIVGDVAPPVTGIIGEQEYVYPTLDAAGYFMWQQTSELQVRNIWYSPFYYGAAFRARHWSVWHTGFRGGYYNPWFGLSYAGVSRSGLRVTHRNGHSQGSRSERNKRSERGNRSERNNRSSNARSNNSTRRSSSTSARRSSPSRPVEQQK